VLAAHVQVWDAHNYLLANPCKPTPVLVITTSLNSKHDKTHTKNINTTDAAGHHFGGSKGAYFKITVTMRDPVTRTAVSNVPVTITLDPAGLAKCGAGPRTTGRMGGAVWSCSRVKGASGSLTITATSAETDWWAAATDFITVAV
jgi:hypothetical protein